MSYENDFAAAGRPGQGSTVGAFVRSRFGGWVPRDHPDAMPDEPQAIAGTMQDTSPGMAAPDDVAGPVRLGDPSRPQAPMYPTQDQGGPVTLGNGGGFNAPTYPPQADASPTDQPMQPYQPPDAPMPPAPQPDQDLGGYQGNPQQPYGGPEDVAQANHDQQIQQQQGRNPWRGMVPHPRTGPTPGTDGDTGYSGGPLPVGEPGSPGPGWGANPPLWNGNGGYRGPAALGDMAPRRQRAQRGAWKSGTAWGGTPASSPQPVSTLGDMAQPNTQQFTERKYQP